MSIQFTCDRCGEITGKKEWEGKTLDVETFLDMDDEEFEEDGTEYQRDLSRKFDMCQDCCHKLEDKLRDFFYKLKERRLKEEEHLKNKPKKKRVTKKED